MLKTLFEQQRTYLNHFFDCLNFKEIEPIYQKLVACKGSILFTGVGKSAHIAEKIAKTFLSIGVPGLFLSAEHAFHGDLAIVRPEDMILLFSKSGASDELIQLVPYLKQRKALTVAVVSDHNSHLSKLCDFTVHLPLAKELCPLNLAPTTSSAIQLIFGDCLAIALMQQKKFTKDDFAKNHPGGLLGKRLSLTVSDLMKRGAAIPKAKMTDRLVEVLHELSGKRCGCMLIVDQKERLQGIFTDGDLRRALEKLGSRALERSMQELMTLSPRTISSSSLAIEALYAMQTPNPVTALAVLDQSQVIGLVHMHDLIHAGLQ